MNVLKLPSKNRFILGILGVIVIIIILNMVIPKPSQVPSLETSSTSTPIETSPSESVSQPSPTSAVLNETKQQTSGDYLVGQHAQSVVLQYPFVTKLPLITKNYTVVFDTQDATIQVLLNGSITQNQISPEIQSQLQKIGVPADISVVYVPPYQSTP